MTDAATSSPPKAPHSRKGLYIPLGIFLAVLTAWTAWWFVLARQVEARVVAQAETLADSGWAVEHAEMRVTGWPFRARLAIPHARLIAPSGHGVAAPQLIAEANAYNPTRWVVIAPEGLVLSRGDKGEVAVRGDAIRMSVSGLTQRWPNVAVEMVKPVFTAHAAADVFPIGGAERIELYMRPHVIEGRNAPGDDVDVLFRLMDAEGRPDGPVSGLAQNGRLTAQLEAVVTDASRLRGMDSAGVFSAWTQAGGHFTRIRGEVEAGDSRATVASDDLRADEEGRLIGQVTLRAEQPSAAIAGLAGSATGAVDRPGAARAAAQTPGAGDLVLTFRNGRTFLGPFTLAPAPKLF